MKKLSLVAVVAALAAPGTAAAARQSGIVVKVDANADVIAVAQTAGHVVRVHAPAPRFARNGKRFHVGQRISFAARKLRNGTLAASGFRVTGRASRVSVHGIVRAYNSQKRRIILATGGMLVRMRLGHATRAALASAPPPKVGDEVTVTASVDENDDQQAEQDDQAEQGDDQAEPDEDAEDPDSAQASGDGSGSADDGEGD